MKEEFGWFWDGLNVHLNRNQLKQTKQRRIILEEFLRLSGSDGITCNHVEAEDLHERVRSRGNNVGLATVYRTLNLLKDAGLVQQRSFVDGRSTFELLRPNSHHDHLICTECDTIIEFEDPVIEEQQRLVAERHNFVLTSHHLDMFGQCASCRS